MLAAPTAAEREGVVWAEDVLTVPLARLLPGAAQLPTAGSRSASVRAGMWQARGSYRVQK